MSTALVTGTSSGIGLATAVSLARAGHVVAATMRNLDRAGDLRKIAADEQLPIDIAALDVDDDASVREAFATIAARHGPIDVLVNNAGVPGGGAIEETPVESFREVMETNYFGALRCMKEVVPGMRQRRRGTIVNVTSVAGRTATAPMASYAASKWALEALSECLAQEMRAFNVRVAIVEPGVIATPIFGKGRSSAPDSPYPHGRRLRALFAAAARQSDPAISRRRPHPRHRQRRQLAASLSGGTGRGADDEGTGDEERRTGRRGSRRKRRGLPCANEARFRARP